MLSAIGTEMIGGLVLGFIAKDWADRFLFVWIVGLVACLQMFFYVVVVRGIMRVDLLKVIEREKSPTWKLYRRQFIFSTVAALPFSLLGGFVRVLFFK